MYYSPDKILSRNALISFIIGERGVGKTFSFKRYGINHFKKKKRKFAWVRRYDSDLDSAIGNRREASFFKGLHEFYPNSTFKIESHKKIRNIIINDSICGYGLSLKSAESLKGTEFSDVDTIIFDEVLVGDGGSHYLRDEPMYLLSLIESIARTRDIRVILLANATSSYNPYFDFFKIHINPNKEFSTFKNGTIVVQYVKNEEYREFKRKSRFGELVKGTKYESYAIDNNFITDDNSFVKKKEPSARLFFNIKNNNEIIGVWLDKKGMYISYKYNPNNTTTISLSLKDHNESTVLIKNQNVFIKNIINHYKKGNLYFDSMELKYKFLDLLKQNHFIY